MIVRSKNFYLILTSAIALGAFAGCATGPKKSLGSAAELFEAACTGYRAPGKKTAVLKGSIWAKVESPELKGQFPATVLAEAPGKLALEVTNLIGAPQAWLKIEAGRIQLKLTPENQRAWGQQSVRAIWGGLPLEMAPDLFLGKIPCPPLGAGRDLRTSVLGDQLEVISTDVKTQSKNRYLYSFESYAGRPWPNALTYEGVVRGGQRVKIDFEFEDPSDSEYSPKKWSATSSRGAVTIRWKDRTVENGE